MSLKQWFRNWLEIDKNEQDVSVLAGLIRSLEAEAHTHEDEPGPGPEPPALELSHYVDEQRRARPDLSDEELAETYWATCIVSDSYMYTADIDRFGKYKRNDSGNMIFEQATAKENELKQGDEVLVYRWAFPVDGGVVRASVYQPTLAVNIKHFTKPE